MSSHDRNRPARVTGFAAWDRAVTATYEGSSSSQYLGNNDVRSVLAAMKLAATDDNMMAAAKLIAKRGCPVRIVIAAGTRTFLPPVAGKPPSIRSAGRKRYGAVNRPTENAAIGRITGEARRRAEREERLAASEAREMQP